MDVRATPGNDARIRVMVAAEGAAMVRLVTALSGPHVCLVHVGTLDDAVAERVRRLEVDVLVLSGGAAAVTIAEQVAATASRVSVMIVDDPSADTRVLWPKDRTYRVAGSVEPLLPPELHELSPA